MQRVFNELCYSVMLAYTILISISQKRRLGLRKVKEYLPSHTVRKAKKAGIGMRWSDFKACALNDSTSIFAPLVLWKTGKSREGLGLR